MAALPLTIKEKSLWKRLAQQYEPEELMSMIDDWMDQAKEPAKFIIFYMRAESIHQQRQPKDYTWE